MSTPAPKTSYSSLPRHRRRGPRALAFSLMFLVVMSVYGLYANGYGVLIGFHDEPTADGKMNLKRCSYFTGRETVINHVMRMADDKRGKPSCELVKKVYVDPTETQPQNQQQMPSGPIIEIKPDSAPQSAPQPPATTPPSQPSSAPPP